MDFFDFVIQKKFKDILNQYHKICDMLCYEEVLLDKKLTIQLSKQKSMIEPVALCYEKIKSEKNDCEIEKLKSDAINLLCKLDSTNQNFTVELIAQNDSQQCLYFCSYLFVAYKNFCKKNNFQLEIVDSKDMMENSLKSVIFNVQGNDANCFFETESGFHKAKIENNFQYVCVYAYKKIEYSQPSFNDGDLKIDIFRSNGAGGQNVNKVSSAVRITHLKTKIVSVCQDERSQFQNKERALQNLKQKVNAQFLKNYKDEIEKVKHQQQKLFNKNNFKRLYNFDEKIVQDKNYGLNFNMDIFENGELDKLFEFKKIREKIVE